MFPHLDLSSFAVGPNDILMGTYHSGPVFRTHLDFRGCVREVGDLGFYPKDPLLGLLADVAQLCGVSRTLICTGLGLVFVVKAPPLLRQGQVQTT